MTLSRISYILLIFFTHAVFAQNEANVWIFDKNMGIDFNHDRFRPFILPFEMERVGGTSVMCDSETGELLFFTNTRNVWDRRYVQMRNGRNLKGGGGSLTDQAVIIVPVPENNRQYYVFTAAAPENSQGLEPGLFYTVVDMELNGGLGDVDITRKNIKLLNDPIARLMAVPHSNGRDYWLITHEWNTDRFIVVPVTAEGPGTPQYIPIGSVYRDYDGSGGLKISPDGTKLACGFANPTNLSNPLELYDFDASTGGISNKMNIGNYHYIGGVSFSPDNSKIYLADHYQAAGIIIHELLYQMDITSGNEEAIINSRESLYFVYDPLIGSGLGYDTLSFGNLQLTPDGRLHVGLFAVQRDYENGQVVQKRNLFYIDKPNQPGWLSKPSIRLFITEGFPGISTNIGFGQPNIMQYYFNNLLPDDNYETGECDVVISVYPNPTSRMVSIALEGGCSVEYSIRVYNAIGKTLIDIQRLAIPFYTFDLSSHAPGIYLLEVSTSRQKNVFKIIKR